MISFENSLFHKKQSAQYMVSKVKQCSFTEDPNIYKYME